MRKALQRFIFYALLLPEFISSAAFAQNSSVYPVNSPPPEFEVDSIAPKKGPAWGETIVTIYGKKLLKSSSFEIRFGGIPGTDLTHVDNQTLTVKSPRHPLGIKNADTVQITVTDLKGKENVTKVSPDSFIYVRPGTKLSILPVSAYYNGNIELNTTLTDSAGTPIDSQTVTFTLGGLPAGAAMTDSNGLAKLNVALSGVGIGIHSGYIGAGFAENFYYKSSTAQAADLTVKPIPSALTVNSPAINYGESTEFKAVLTSLGAPLPGKTVNFTLNNNPAGSAVTQNDGSAALPLNQSPDAGSYTIKAVFAETGHDTSSASGTLTVNKAPTNLIVNNADADGSTVTLKARLTSNVTGLGIPNDTISFSFTGGSYAGFAVTDQNGAAEIPGVIVPDNLGPGLHKGAIKASFAGSRNYIASSGFGDMTINKTNTSLSVSSAAGTYGGSVSLKAELKSGGADLAGQTVKFYLNDVPAGQSTTGSDGIANYTAPLGTIDAGTYPEGVKAVFEGAGSYGPANAANSLTVSQAPTSLKAASLEAGYGSTITLSAILVSDVTQAGIPGKTITFTIQGGPEAAASTDGNGTASASVNLGTLSAGTHDILAVFSPSGSNYKGSSGKATLTVKAASAALVVTNASGTYGGAVTLEAKLTSSGSALAGQTVKFTFNNKTYSASTNASGVAQAGGVSIAGFGIGEYPGVILAEFAGMDGYAYSSAYGKLTVLPAPAAVSVTSITGVYGETVDLSAVLTSGGVPLSGRTLSFELNGTNVGNALTESDGRATLQGVSLSGINAGVYKDITTVSFAASGNYSTAKGSGNLTVTQAPTLITVSKATGLYNGKTSLKATLTASSGSPVSGRTINFKLNGIDKGSAVTDNNGAAVLADVSIADIAAGTYNNYIEAGFNPSGGNYAASTGKGQLEVDLAQTNIAVNKITADYGSKVTLTATLTSQEGAPLSGRTVEFFLNSVSVGTAVTDQNGVASKTDVDLSGTGAGFYAGYISAVFAESNSYKGSSNKADLEIKKASTAVSVIQAEVQYSDQITLTAVVTSLSAREILNAAGGSVEFRYQEENETAKLLAAVASFSIVNGSLNFNYTFTCTLAPGTYKIIAAFTPSAKNNFEDSYSTSPWGPLIVKPEDVLIEYTGPMYFVTPSLTDFNTSLNLTAALTDMPDGSRGNITMAKTEFREVAIDESFDNGILRGKDIPVLLLNQADITTGTAASPSFKRNLSQAEKSNEGATFCIYTSAEGNYYKLSDPALVTVAIPAESNISGGGFIVPNSSAGKYRSQAGTKTGFGFSMKYYTSGSSVPGQANFVIRGESSRIYLIKSSLISSVSAYTIKNMPGKAASFNAKADLKDLTDPRNPVTLATGLSLYVEIYDDDKNNENDAMAITLRDNNSVLLYSSNWDGSKTISQTLAAPKGGGVIRVLNLSRPVDVEGEKIMPKEYALYQNFPNPFNPSTSIQFDLPEESRVSIVIYNILGREVTRLVDKDLPAGRHLAVWNSQDGGSYASGMYILRITAKSNISQRSLVSTKKMMLVK